MVVSMDIATRPGRPCSVCSHVSRNEVEAALLTLTVSSVAARFEIAERSLYRHRAEHLPEQLREQVRPAKAIRATDLLGVGGEVLRRARAVAERAEERGHDLLVLRAGDAALRATTALADRLGIRDTDALDVIAAAEAVVRAVGAVSIASPEVGTAVVAQLRQNDHHDIAAELEEAISKTKNMEGIQ